MCKGGLVRFLAFVALWLPACLIAWSHLSNREALRMLLLLPVFAVITVVGYSLILERPSD